MTLQDRINADLKTAMINKDDNKKSLLRVIIGEFSRIDEKKITISDNKKIIADEEIIKILRKMKENAELLNNKIEINIINEYLPIVFDINKTKTIISDIICKNNYTSVSDMGKIMGELKKSPNANNIDFKLVGQLAKELLS